MANPATKVPSSGSTEPNGVASATTPGDLPLATVTGSLATSDFSATETTALRHSVAKSQKGYGTAVAASEVYSETQDLRFAYGGVEADSPAVTRT